MSNFSQFMKQNKVKKENVEYVATKSLIDQNGEPLIWTLKPLTTKENDAIRDDCTKEVPIPGKSNVFRQKLNTSKYIAKMICASVVEPNLNDKELQDSYGVMGTEELLKERVDDPGEYADLALFIQEFNGFTANMDEKVAEAKN